MIKMVFAFPETARHKAMDTLKTIRNMLESLEGCKPQTSWCMK